ncbi:MAG: hypothetical protein ABJA79_01775 [Parafilimonas sp.]
MNRITLLLICIILTTTLHAQKTKNSDSNYAALKWRSIGPYRGGRCLAVSGVIGDPYTYYMGATGGGVWKTTDGGNTWLSISDTTFHSSSVGSIAIAPSNPNIIYVGMGEYAIRNTAIMGDGIYKSIDAGKTWNRLLWLDASAVAHILVHPSNADVVYAAVMGKMFGANKERGVYKSMDGGKTWKQILYKNDSTGAINIQFDPNNPSILYASLWQCYRNSWSLNDGGSGSGLYKSIDGGDTWQLISNNAGLPKGIYGKITTAVAASNSNHVYAMMENKNGGLFSSMDAGKTWARVSTNNDLTQRPWYFSGVWVDPKNETHVFVMNVEYWQSIDGGKTFTRISQEHGDNHDMWINPNNPDNFIIGDDGSAAVTFNGGKTWTDEDLPTGQFYHVNLDNDFPYNAYGGQQDWGPIRVATRTTGYSISKNDWYTPAGGEAGYIVPDPKNPQVTYGGEYDGIMTRHDKSNNQYQVVSVYPEINDGAGVVVKKHRFQWTYPISFSPWNDNTIYCTSQYVHRSTNGGMSWEIISPDLTTNDTTKQRQSGGPITADNTGAEVYCDIYAFAESPAQQGVLWAGSDDGLVHVSRDNGKSWDNVTPAALPKWATVSIIDPSHFDAGTCFFAAHAYRLDNTKPYIFRTTDYGKTWQLITTGLAPNVYTRCVREDPNRKSLLYAGTETGMYVSFNNGDNWQSLQMNLPVTPVHDIQIKKDMKEVVLATHGRAFWVLDDVSPLYEMSNEIGKSNAYLFTPRVSYRMDGGQYDAPDFQDGANAPNGVIVYYMLKKPVSKELKLEFLTAKGDSIITYSNLKDRNGKAIEKNEDFYEEKKDKIEGVLKNEPGMYRFVWDMSYPEAKRFSDDWIYNYQLGAIRTLPGNYLVRLYNGDTLLMERSASVTLNPKVKTLQADLQAQTDLLNDITKKQIEISTAIKQIHSIEKQINDFTGSIEDTTKARPLKDLGKPILDSLGAIEEVLYQPKIKAGEDGLRFPVKLMEKLGGLKVQIANSDNKPTQQEYDLFADLSQRFTVPLQKLKKIVDTEIPKFNDAAAKYKTLPVDVTKGLK